MLVTMVFFALGVVLGVGVTIAGGVVGIGVLRRRADSGQPPLWGPWVVSVEDALCLADDLEITGEKSDIAVACIVLAEAYRTQLGDLPDDEAPDMAPDDEAIAAVVPLVPIAAQ